MCNENLNFFIKICQQKEKNVSRMEGKIYKFQVNGNKYIEVD